MRSLSQLFVIAAILQVPLSSVGDAQTLNTRDNATELDLRRYIQRQAEETGVSGSVLVRHNGKTLYAGCFGQANRSFRVPNQIDTRFRIASVTKVFTAALILKLRDADKLELQDTIGRHLPNYPGPGRDKVTVHQLLNHTSGIYNIDSVITSKGAAIARGIEHYQTPHTSDEMLTRYSSGKLVSEPGEKFNYNDAEYIILGKIIERLYGKPFDVVLDDELLQPLGLNDTGVGQQWKIVERLADTYMLRDGVDGLTHDLPVYWENWYASGAMYSTTADLADFSDALFSGKLLSADSLQLLLTPGLDGYGYGLWLRSDTIDGKSYKAMHRPGSIMGAQAGWYHLLEPNITVIILANTDQANIDQLLFAIGTETVKLTHSR